MGRRHKRTGRKNGRKLNKKQLKQVKSIITRRSETKFIDSNQSFSPSGSGGISTSFSVIPQGQSDQSRVGDKITLKSLRTRTTIVGADSTNFVRIVWFQWIPNNAVQTPAVTSLLQNPTNWLSPINETNAAGQLFRIMSDKMYSTSLNGTNAIVSARTFYGRALPRKSVEYNPGSATGYMQLYCMVISDSVAIAHPAVVIYSRLEYTDA